MITIILCNLVQHNYLTITNYMSVKLFQLDISITLDSSFVFHE